MKNNEKIIYLTPTPPRRNALQHIWDEIERSSLCVARIKVASEWAKIEPGDHAEWGLTEERGTLSICKVCRRIYEKRRVQPDLPKARQHPTAGPWSKYSPPYHHYCWAYTEHHR